MVPPGAVRPRRPMALVRLPWGSTSTRRTRCSARARDAARLMVVVVLPTPPFWLVTARTRDMFLLFALKVPGFDGVRAMRIRRAGSGINGRVGGDVVTRQGVK